MTNQIHIPILVNEIIEHLEIDPNDTVLDATMGFGGHSSAFLSKLSNRGKLIGIDRDLEAVTHCKTKFKSNKNVHIKGNMNMTVDGDLRQLVYGNYHLEVEKDFTMNIKGSLQQGIQGNHEAEIARNRSINIGSNDNLLVNNDLIQNVIGRAHV